MRTASQLDSISATTRDGMIALAAKAASELLSLAAAYPERASLYLDAAERKDQALTRLFVRRREARKVAA